MLQLPAVRRASACWDARWGSASYQARLRFDTNGAVRFYVVRSAGSDVVIGGSSQTLTSSYSPGDTIKVKFAVTGTSPTTVAAKAWLKSSAEPTSWQFETTDTEATLQAAGAVGLRIAVSSASTVPTTTFSVDNLVTTTTTEAPAENVAPVAVFSSSSSGLDASVRCDGVVGFRWHCCFVCVGFR